MQFNVKRFKIETTTLHNKFFFIKEGEGNRLEAVTTDAEPVILIKSGRGAQAKTQKIKINNFAEVMGWKAVGTKIFDFNKSVEMEWELKPNKKQQELF